MMMTQETEACVCGGNLFLAPLCLMASGYISASTVTLIIIILPHFSEANGMKF